jgi:hypothetical protein
MLVMCKPVLFPLVLQHLYNLIPTFEVKMVNLGREGKFFLNWFHSPCSIRMNNQLFNLASEKKE